jgi:hypothetical protein
MDNSKEVLQSLIEHEITYSRGIHETEQLWKLHQALTSEQKESKSFIRIPKIHQLFITGIAAFVAAYLFDSLFR